MLEGAFDPPDWFIPFTNMQAFADELRCSVMAAADADPEWRQMATINLLAHAEAKRRREPSSAK